MAQRSNQIRDVIHFSEDLPRVRSDVRRHAGVGLDRLGADSHDVER
jgi:hypothetical protein